MPFLILTFALEFLENIEEIFVYCRPDFDRLLSVWRLRGERLGLLL